MRKLNLSINQNDLFLGYLLQVLTYRSFEIFKNKIIDEDLLKRWINELLINNYKYKLEINGKKIIITFTKINTEPFKVLIDLELNLTESLSIIDGESILDKINIFEIVYS